MKDLWDTITEKQWQDAIIERARLYGWWAWHDYDSRRNQAGLPDLILVRPPRVLFVEVKHQRGRLSVEQRGVISMLEECPGVEVHVWRPSNERSLDDVLRPG